MIVLHLPDFLGSEYPEVDVEFLCVALTISCSGILIAPAGRMWETSVRWMPCGISAGLRGQCVRSRTAAAPARLVVAFRNQVLERKYRRDKTFFYYPAAWYRGVLLRMHCISPRALRPPRPHSHPNSLRISSSESLHSAKSIQRPGQTLLR